MSVVSKTSSAVGAKRPVRKIRGWRWIRKDISAWLLAVPALIVFLIFSWEPLLSQIYYSFFNFHGFTPTTFAGLQNYKDVLTNSGFRETLFNTLIYVFWSLVLGWPVPILAALFINEMRWFKSFFKFSIYFPVMIPQIATALMWNLIYNPSQQGFLNQLLTKLGLPMSQWLQNSHLTIILITVTMVWSGFGGTTLLYLASLQGVNRELYEAAAIDGSGILRRIWNVTLPSIAPILKLLLILQISGIFQIFVQPLAMTSGGPNNASMSLLLQGYYDAFSFSTPQDSMAIGVIMFVILAIISIFYLRTSKED